MKDIKSLLSCERYKNFHRTDFDVEQEAAPGGPYKTTTNTCRLRVQEDELQTLDACGLPTQCGHK